VPHQELLQQRANTFVVIDDQQVCVGLVHAPFSFRRV
jgi:hypothetical protein